MKLILIILFCTALLYPVFSESKLDYKSVILKSERFPEISSTAKKLAIDRNLPISIFIKNKAFMQPVVVENNEVVYSVITNMLHPLKNGSLATFEEIEKNFDLENAEIKYYQEIYREERMEKVNAKTADPIYLIPESTNRRVMACSTNGDTITTAFIPAMPLDTLYNPIKILYHNVRKTFLISDRDKDVIQEFDTTGTYLRVFAPRGGRSVNILDVNRGIAFHPNGNLLVTNAGGINQDAIAAFDLFGMFDNFIEPADSIMDSPFDILVRSGDILITAINSMAIHKYDLDGNYLGDFATGIAFPEQIIELSNGDIAVANFDGETGIQIYPAAGGSYSQILTGVTNNRGIAELDNGNLLTTNGSGVFIIDRTTGDLIDTKIPGVSAKFISFYTRESFTGNSGVSLSNNLIEFGNVMKDSTKTDSLNINNIGNADLLIYSLASTNPDISISPDTGQIAVNDSMMFEITFTAVSDSGNENGSLIIESNSPSRYDTININVSVITDIENNEKKSPTIFNLSQNYPNPFNPSTTIQYTVPKMSKVTLKIYNIAGEEIRTLVNKVQTPGDQSVIWDGTNNFGERVSSGIYFYRIAIHSDRYENADYVQTKKMMLLR